MPPPAIDKMHGAISSAFVTPIAAFDRLFFSEREELETNSSYLRVIVGPDWVNGEGFRLRGSVRAKVRVPALKDRLNLLVTDEDDDDAARTGRTDVRRTAISRSRAVSRLDRDARGSRSRAGVGYGLLREFDTDVDLETALRSRGRLELSLRVRQKFPVVEEVKSRLIVTGFWLQGTGFGSRTRMNFEKPLRRNAVFHWDNAVTQVHRIDGVVLDSRVSLDAQISERAGVSPSVSMNAVTRPRWRAEAFAASVLFRRQFFRDWMFYEIEPGVSWPTNAERARAPVPTAAFRIEVQFREAE